MLQQGNCYKNDKNIKKLKKSSKLKMSNETGKIADELDEAEGN